MKLSLYIILLLLLPSSAYSVKIKKGDVFPTFKLKTLDNLKEFSLEDFKGKVVVLDLWAHWCAPCLEAMPELVKLQTKYGLHGLQVVGVNVDHKIPKAIEFVKKFRPNFPIVHDKSQKYLKKINIQVLPTTFILDHKLRLKALFRGYGSSTKKNLERQIKKLLQQVPLSPPVGKK